jgi:phosphoenolpyruvate carboxylase
MNSSHSIATGFRQIDDKLTFLIRCLQDVLTEMGHPELAACLPWSQDEASTHNDGYPERAGQAFAVAFQLLNMVEENASTNVRRTRETEKGITAEHGMWGQSLESLKQDFSPEQIASVMKRVRVEPVLTAHPTEAKRLAILEAHRELYRLIARLDNPLQTPSERDLLRNDIKAALERVWRSGEVLLAKPNIADERRNVLHYLRHVFPTVLPGLDRRLQQAWQNAGFDAQLIDEPQSRPRLHFGTWVGGDRDGHPLVTPEVTRQTLGELRLHALLLIRDQLTRLAHHMSLSSHVQKPSASFSDQIAQRAQELGEGGRQVLATYWEEPWRQWVELSLLKLPLQHHSTVAEMHQHGAAYRYSRDLLADLNWLHISLCEVGARRIAENEVEPVMQAVEVFGFHLASLDVRQNSRYHDVALSQLTKAAGMRADFETLSEEDRLHFLNTELNSPRPFLHPSTLEYSQEMQPGDEAQSVLACYRVLATHIREYGPNGLGALIVSMTRSLSDLLAVYVLAREAGLVINTPQGLVCQLPVVPLFETLDDLERGAGILRAFLAHPMTRRSLEWQSRNFGYGRNDGRLLQQVMVGYSDSNKDAGIFASQWGLQKAQNEMALAGRESGTEIRFFHGRGGTVSRGAGPTHRFLEALPHGSLSGDMRLTEQGETFAQKYANLDTATYNLELLLAGVTETTVRHEYSKSDPHPLERIGDRLTQWSRDAYRALLETEGFMDFYGQATPIDALEHARIGSRPARRSGRKTLDDLRAIPWVFAWNQARFYLPGWFGVGSALQRLESEDAAAFTELCEQIPTWKFGSYLLTNIETMLASANLKIMREYSQLVEDEELRTRFMSLIETEFTLTNDYIDRVFSQTFEARRPRMAKTLELRAEALRRLHQQQIQVLRQWREYSLHAQTDDADAMLPQLLLSINAIASGLRTTG